MTKQKNGEEKSKEILIYLALALALMAGASTFAVPVIKSGFVFDGSGDFLFFGIGVFFYVASLVTLYKIFKLGNEKRTTEAVDKIRKTEG